METRLLIVIASLALLQGCSDSQQPGVATVAPSKPQKSDRALKEKADADIVVNKPEVPALEASVDTEDVDYYNPNTGTSSSYELEVERDEDGEIQRINFPNGGWLDVSDDLETNDDGSQTYTNEDGVEYTIEAKDVPDPDSDDVDSRFTE